MVELDTWNRIHLSHHFIRESCVRERTISQYVDRQRRAGNYDTLSAGSPLSPPPSRLFKGALHDMNNNSYCLNTALFVWPKDMEMAPKDHAVGMAIRNQAKGRTYIEKKRRAKQLRPVDRLGWTAPEMVLRGWAMRPSGGLLEALPPRSSKMEQVQLGGAEALTGYGDGGGIRMSQSQPELSRPFTVSAVPEKDRGGGLVSPPCARPRTVSALPEKGRGGLVSPPPARPGTVQELSSGVGGGCPPREDVDPLPSAVAGSPGRGRRALPPVIPPPRRVSPHPEPRVREEPILQWCAGGGKDLGIPTT